MVFNKCSEPVAWIDMRVVTRLREISDEASAAARIRTWTAGTCETDLACIDVLHFVKRACCSLTTHRPIDLASLCVIPLTLPVLLQSRWPRRPVAHFLLPPSSVTRTARARFDSTCALLRPLVPCLPTIPAFVDTLLSPTVASQPALAGGSNK